MTREISIGKINETVESCNGQEGFENNVALEPTDVQVDKTMEYDSEDNCTPNWYCQIVVSHHRLAFGITLGLHILMIIITIILLTSGYNLLQIDFTGIPLNLQRDTTKLRTDAWWYVTKDKTMVTLTGAQETRAIQYQAISMVYEFKGGNIFAKENLLAIKRNEDDLFNSQDYQKKLCLLQGNSSCKPLLSILRFFDGTYREINPRLYDPEFLNISSVLYAAQSVNLSNAILNFHLGRDAVVTKDTASSPYTRSLIYTGWPIKGYSSTDDRDDDQAKEIDRIIIDTFGRKLEKKYKDGVENMNFYYDNVALKIDAIQRQVLLDMLLAVASFVFIFLFMWFQTGSLWLTTFGIFSIISSFNIANLIYRIIFDYRYIGIFHVLSIFIILGIGADDIFVFMDTWKQSRSQSFKSLAHRLSSVYRRAAKATLVTSFTTMIAFLSNALSPLLAISSFGLFSAILIAVNYISVIIFFPTVIILHHISRKGQCCCAPMPCKGGDKHTPTDGGGNKHTPTDGGDKHTPTDGGGDKHGIPTDGGVDKHTPTDGGGNKHTSTYGDETRPPGERRKKNLSDHIIQFFEGWFFRNIVSHRVIRWVVIISFLLLAIVSIGFATQLQPFKDQVRIWKPNTNWRKVRDLGQNAFLPSQEDRVVIVHIIWGLQKQDRSECHHTDYKCKGKTVFDKSFDLNPPPCQNAMLAFCNKLQNLSPEQEENLKVRRSQVTGEIEIKCIFERMNEYLKAESNQTKYKLSFPIDEEQMRALMQAKPEIYNVTLPDTYYRYFEIGAGYFMTQGATKDYGTSFDYVKYEDLIGGERDPTTLTNKMINQGDKYGSRLLYVALTVNTTLNPSTLGYEKGLRIYDYWEKFVNEEMSTMPPSCNNGFQATVSHFNIWHWLKIQKILMNNARIGIIAGLLFAFIILTIATTNVIVAFMATVIIAMVTCGVLGIIPIIGWKLGLFESLNLTLVVGLAVDYVVHLAEGYMELKDQDRLTRVRYTLGHVGISVTSGACTTLGASIFMLAAKIVFFSQFGIFIFCTIGLSILYSLFLFTTVLALIGPEGESGSLLPIVRKIKNYFRGKTKHHVDCDTCKGKGFHKNDSKM